MNLLATEKHLIGRHQTKPCVGVFWLPEQGRAENDTYIRRTRASKTALRFGNANQNDQEDRLSREKLDMIVRERSSKERFEQEKRRLLAEKEGLRNKYHHLTSSQTLQKLASPAYFSRGNLSSPEFTTKIERQVIERMDHNVWVDDMRIPSHQTLEALRVYVPGAYFG
ncbi:hypothetical protein NECAME_13538 [Necator americanus]|uniref:Uncharacterized protein n=1 Tax=Necator americanus TaxID=51031 RepID=W2SXQ8_NECAM|nr:hypothetical protein NECAME_13538 [Necator americanus]ETN73392.1 hypothetical protein NECAME_13538 [Necator americanus]